VLLLVNRGAVLTRISSDVPEREVSVRNRMHLFIPLQQFVNVCQEHLGLPMFNCPNFGLPLRRNYEGCVYRIPIASRGDQARFVESANLGHGNVDAVALGSIGRS
jgi:hypothetical protein